MAMIADEKHRAKWLECEKDGFHKWDQEDIRYIGETKDFLMLEAYCERCRKKCTLSGEWEEEIKHRAKRLECEKDGFHKWDQEDIGFVGESKDFLMLEAYCERCHKKCTLSGEWEEEMEYE